MVDSYWNYKIRDSENYRNKFYKQINMLLKHIIHIKYYIVLIWKLYLKKDFLVRKVTFSYYVLTYSINI